MAELCLLSFVDFSLSVDLIIAYSYIIMSFVLDRNVVDFPKFLGIAMETFLMLCDDPESDVRMVADECLNRTIKVGVGG